jgi:acyl carrier protein
MGKMDLTTEENEVVDRIRMVFQGFVTEKTELDAVFRGEPILTALSIDSLTMLNLVTELEKVFNVRFDYETIELVFQDVHSLSAFLSRKSERV